MNLQPRLVQPLGPWPELRCRKGHEMTPENLSRDALGRAHCLACRSEGNQRRLEAIRANRKT